MDADARLCQLHAGRLRTAVRAGAALSAANAAGAAVGTVVEVAVAAGGGPARHPGRPAGSADEGKPVCRRPGRDDPDRPAMAVSGRPLHQETGRPAGVRCQGKRQIAISVIAGAAAASPALSIADRCQAQAHHARRTGRRQRLHRVARIASRAAAGWMLEPEQRHRLPQMHGLTLQAAGVGGGLAHQQQAVLRHLVDLEDRQLGAFHAPQLDGRRFAQLRHRLAHLLQRRHDFRHVVAQVRHRLCPALHLRHRIVYQRLDVVGGRGRALRQRQHLIGHTRKVVALGAGARCRHRRVQRQQHQPLRHVHAPPGERGRAAGQLVGQLRIAGRLRRVVAQVAHRCRGLLQRGGLAFGAPVQFRIAARHLARGVIHGLRRRHDGLERGIEVADAGVERARRLGDFILAVLAVAHGEIAFGQVDRRGADLAQLPEQRIAHRHGHQQRQADRQHHHGRHPDRQHGEIGFGVAVVACAERLFQARQLGQPLRHHVERPLRLGHGVGGNGVVVDGDLDHVRHRVDVLRMRSLRLHDETALGGVGLREPLELRKLAVERGVARVDGAHQRVGTGGREAGVEPGEQLVRFGMDAIGAGHQVGSGLEPHGALLHHVIERLVLPHHAKIRASGQHQQQDQHHPGRQQQFGTDTEFAQHRRPRSSNKTRMIASGRKQCTHESENQGRPDLGAVIPRTGSLRIAPGHARLPVHRAHADCHRPAAAHHAGAGGPAGGRNQQRRAAARHPADHGAHQCGRRRRSRQQRGVAGAPHIGHHQAELEHDQRPGGIVHSPRDPQRVTDQKTPEAGLAPARVARTHQPGGQQMLAISPSPPSNAAYNASTLGDADVRAGLAMVGAGGARGLYLSCVAGDGAPVRQAHRGAVHAVRSAGGDAAVRGGIEFALAQRKIRQGGGRRTGAAGPRRRHLQGRHAARTRGQGRRGPGAARGQLPARSDEMRVSGSRRPDHRDAARRGVPAGAQGAAGKIPGSGHQGHRLRGDLAWPEKLEWRRHPGARRGADRSGSRPARRPGRRTKPLPRGGGARRAHLRPVSAQWESRAGSQVRLQAEMVRAPDQACCGPDRGRHAHRDCRRLQRHAHRARCVQAGALGGRRPVPARDARGVPPPDGAGLDRCAAHHASRRNDLYLF
uniref:Uncharacterized protein n=1 Tax=Tanacetum cinerariifolium TaxID=118510 RepID=A0A699GLZ0_TANCI|nr:hypothetical protein [Tanacetum cinerariifolium]